LLFHVPGDRKFMIIVWKTLFDTIPYEIRVPATEAREQLAANIASGDFSKMPGATFLLAPYLGLVAATLAVVGLAAYRFKRRWGQKRRVVGECAA